MSTHNMCFCREIKKKNISTFWLKNWPYLELWWMVEDARVIFMFDGPVEMADEARVHC